MTKTNTTNETKPNTGTSASATKPAVKAVNIGKFVGLQAVRNAKGGLDFKKRYLNGDKETLV